MRIRSDYMQRWEYFNILCGEEKTLNEQMTEIVKVKIKNQNNVDVASLAQHIKEWLMEGE